MPRAIWSGTISFGLVNVAVKLHTATEEKDVSFHQLQEKTGDRIRVKRVSEETGREVDYEDIVKGYEVSKGKHVIVTPEELESVDPGPKRTVAIEDFVGLEEIDPIYFVKTYYVAPADAEGSKKAYVLLRDAMRKSNRVAIGRFVMRTKQYLVAIRPMDDVLILTTLYFSDEVRSWKDLDVPGKVKVSVRELDIALRLIDSLTTAWKPERYDDTYRTKLLKLIKDKAKGKEIVVEPEERPAPVTDLLAALEESVRAARAGRARGTKKAASQSRTSTSRAKKASRPPTSRSRAKKAS
jgi:DNA end-binding protein Ku